MADLPEEHAPAPASSSAATRVSASASRELQDIPMRSFDGVSVERLRSELRVPELHLLASTPSTLDVAHRLGGAGAPHGTLVLAEQQTQGRGRGGKTWSSPPGTGLWITLLARPEAVAILQVITVRLGLAAAQSLDRFAPKPVRIKWPNDLYVASRKLAGVLVEARWRGSSPDWLAVGLGINVASAAHTVAGAALNPGTQRVAVLAALIPAVLKVLARSDSLLDETELAAFARRDLARGLPCREPRPGIVHGITPSAELLIDAGGELVAVNSGSLVLAEEA